jgi:phosphatidylglycerophosphate synthase
VPTVQMGPKIGLILQDVLLAILATTVGLGVAGWVTGVAYGFITCAALARGLYRVNADNLPNLASETVGNFAKLTSETAGNFGPGDWVTLTRATLVGCVAALTADSFHQRAPVEVLVAIATVALVLDAVDGQVARRTGTVSDLGARFDMEVDAFLILVLSIHVTRSMGAWVLAIGAMRYAFVVASWALRWMRGPLPQRFWRKVVAATQGVVLVFATAGVLPAPLMVTALAAALALLVESFGRDIVWLWLHAVVEPHRSACASGPLGDEGSCSLDRYPASVRLRRLKDLDRLCR